MDDYSSWFDNDLFQIVAAIVAAFLVLVVIRTTTELCEECPDEALDGQNERSAGRNLIAANDHHGNMAECGPRPSQESFDYDWIRGPHTWNAPMNNQSPINIVVRCLEINYFDTPLTWSLYEVMPLGIRLENNGHTLILQAAFEGQTPSIHGADLLGRFHLWEITFRWSWFSANGSEHSIDNRHSALEMQCLHTDADSQHCASSQGILVISYLFDLCQDNPFLDVLIQHLVAVQQAGQTVEIPPFPLTYLMPAFHNEFYSYHGSLTEPPCHRGAEWFIQPMTLAISERQLNEFRQLRDRRGGRIGKNARPVQPLEDRRVYINQYQA
ncbi:hypothetical protein KR032_001979 [Drosophila birchii]|nr:hypothetical protein KR032_001979 [Drosophila birchii]